MPLDERIVGNVAKMLRHSDSSTTRLVDDARRLWARARRLVGLRLIPETADLDSIELACYALQLPLRSPGGASAKTGRTNLRDRAEQSAEMLSESDGVDERLLDRTTRLLRAITDRSTRTPEARLLADAVNLEDFGVVGLLSQMVQITLSGGGIHELAVGAQKRDDYGYWDARLKDGFHFEPVRQIARQRVESARKMVDLLRRELTEDSPA